MWTKGRRSKYDVPVQIAGETVKEYISSGEFAAEVEKEALARGDSPELARKKAEEAFALHGLYSVGTASGAIGAGSVTGKYGPFVSAGASVLGSVASSKMIKPWIKKQVLEKTEEDYNKPLFPGANPPGPG